MLLIYKGYEIRIFTKEYKDFYEVCKCCRTQKWITKRLEKPIYISNVVGCLYIYGTGESDTKEESIAKAKEHIDNI